MKECFSKKVLLVKGSQNGPIFKGWLIGQWDQGHRVVLHDQGGGNHLPYFTEVGVNKYLTGWHLCVLSSNSQLWSMYL